MSTEVHLSKVPAHSLLISNNKHARSDWDINSPTFRHRAVMSLFGELNGKTARKDAGILFRLDVLPGQTPFFLVQSSAEPANIHQFDGAQTKQITLPNLERGMPVSFRISANAVKRRTIEIKGNKRTQVTPVPIEIPDDDANGENLDAWLRKKLAPALKDVEITNHLRDVLQDSPRGSGSMTLQVDTIDGIALVESSDELSSMLLSGVGREKAYGCGLLTVRALR